MSGEVRVCRVCALPANERYPVTVPVGTEDPGLWRCPAGHIGKPGVVPAVETKVQDLGRENAGLRTRAEKT